MKTIFKAIRLITLIALITALASGCANNEPAAGNGNQPEKSKLIMGLDDTFAPMGFRNEKGELVGFDIDLANEVAKRMDVTIEFQPIDWMMKETELNSGNIDLIWNGYTITDLRKEKVNFSKAYLENSQIIVTLSSSEVNTKADLAGKNIAVQAESSALDAINTDPDFVSSVNEIVEFSTNNEAFMDVEAGRSDAVVMDEVLARYYMKQNGQEKYKVLEEDFGDEEYAVGIRKSDTDLLNNLNKIFEDMINDGTYESIYAKWFSEN
ncbi:amino acid ABC transporter substrate-binding protein [Sedimentibacter sp.]|uniref:amino acid ABC transporter substrate-binding protein n=1 Tax=Sedimentibacter sp. TaxID=1960295 RepID=UPI002899CACA|nr:amino acid ABC transporter substrate-binding protein [Sedimentibacter sp.]